MQSERRNWDLQKSNWSDSDIARNVRQSHELKKANNWNICSE